MQSLGNDEQRKVLGEVLSDQLQAILEYVQEIPSIKTRLSGLEQKVGRVDSRLTVVEGLVRAHEADLKGIKIDLKTIKRHLALA